MGMSVINGIKSERLCKSCVLAGLAQGIQDNIIILRRGRLGGPLNLILYIVDSHRSR